MSKGLELEAEIKDIISKRGNEGSIESFGSIVRDASAFESEDEYKAICKEAGFFPEGEGKAGDGSDEIQKDRVLVFKGSDETVDRYGDIVRVAGWKLDNYKTNPVFLLHHDQRSIPVGRTLKVWKAKGLSDSPNGVALMFKVYFPPASVSESSDAAFKLFKAKMLNATSVGFMPLKVNNPATEEERKSLGLGKYGIEFLEQELWELSGVSVPANPNALQQLSADVQDDTRKSLRLLGIGISEMSTPTNEAKSSTAEDLLSKAVELLTATHKLIELMSASVKATNIDNSSQESAKSSGQESTPEKSEASQVSEKSVYDLLLEELAKGKAE